MAQFGYTTAKLNAGKKLYDEALAAVNMQKSGKGDQKTATADLKAKEKEARDAYQAAAKVARAALDKDGLAKMNEWVAQYLKIAKVALRGKKQSLEKIGVTARTTKTAAQRAAPQKAAATREARSAAKKA